MSDIKVLQLPIEKIFLSYQFLDNLTLTQVPNNFGIKREGYFILNTDKQLYNNENDHEKNIYNMLIRGCNIKQFNLIMIKF